jgi:hypothetical protein
MTLEEFRKAAMKFSDHWFGYDPETQSLCEAHHAATLIQFWDEIPQTELFHYDLAVREAVMEKEMTWEEAMSPQGNLYRTLIAPGLIRHASLPDAFSRGEHGYGGANSIRSFRDLCIMYNTQEGCASVGDGMTNMVCTKGKHACRIYATVNESCKNCPICFKFQNHVKSVFKQQGPFQLPQARRQQQQPQQQGGGNANRTGGRGGQHGGSYASGNAPRGGGGDGQARYSGNVRGRSNSREYRDDRRDRSHSPKPRNRPNKAARSSGKKDDAARTDAS